MLEKDFIIQNNIKDMLNEHGFMPILIRKSPVEPNVTPVTVASKHTYPSQAPTFITQQPKPPVPTIPIPNKFLSKDEKGNEYVVQKIDKSERGKFGLEKFYPFVAEPTNKGLNIPGIINLTAVKSPFNPNNMPLQCQTSPKVLPTNVMGHIEYEPKIDVPEKKNDTAYNMMNMDGVFDIIGESYTPLIVVHDERQEDLLSQKIFKASPYRSLVNFGSSMFRNSKAVESLVDEYGLFSLMEACYIKGMKDAIELSHQNMTVAINDMISDIKAEWEDEC